MLPILSGCGTSGPLDELNKVDLPPVPADLKACFGPSSRAPAPPTGQLTERQINAIIAGLKQSELAHDQCGRRLIAWYEKLVAGYGKKGG